MKKTRKARAEVLQSGGAIDWARNANGLACLPWQEEQNQA